MSNTHESVSESDNSENTQQAPATGPIDRLKLLPMTTPFGLRAAALAGLVLSAGAAASGMAGVFEDPGSVVATTPVCSVKELG